MTAYLDTNVVIRYLTQSPPDAAEASRAYLEGEEDVLLTDLIVAECVHVLTSVYRMARADVADALRSLLALVKVTTVDGDLLRRALDLFESGRLHFPEAYLVACAESRGVLRVASFDRAIDRVPGIERVEPRSA